MITFITYEIKSVTNKKNQSPKLKLVGTDGNAFSLMGRTQQFNNQNKIYSKSDFELIMNEAMAGDYDHLLQTLMVFFEVI